MKVDNVQKYSLQPFVNAVNNAKEALTQKSVNNIAKEEKKMII